MESRYINIGPIHTVSNKHGDETHPPETWFDSDIPYDVDRRHVAEINLHCVM